MRGTNHIPQDVICEVCGKTFAVKYYRKDTARFCSVKCKQIGRAIPQGKCPNCHKIFNARASHGRQKFCSRKCRWEYERKTPKRVQLICEACDKPFWVYQSRLKHQNPRFCSGMCANNIPRSQNERFRRTKTLRWKEIRASIIRRDGGKCAICKRKKNLTVHHIKPWLKSRNDEPANLITLCRSCHYKVEHYGLPCPVPLPFA